MRSSNCLKIVALVLFLSFLFANGQLKENFAHKTFSAKVIGIADGDTMEVLYHKKTVKIRLAHIDAPEKRGSQPFGNNAKKALSDLCFGRTVRVNAQSYDRYQRLIAVVINDKHQNVNQEMVKQGLAWHYKKYSSDAAYAQLQVEARKKRVGLWQDKNPIEPWLWRKNKKNESQNFKSRTL